MDINSNHKGGNSTTAEEETPLKTWGVLWSKNTIGWHKKTCHPMYDEGHTVVGVEVVPKAIQDFFTENGLEYVTEEVKEADGTIYRTEDNRLRVYCCDLFKFSNKIERDFEAVFDRGSLVALGHADWTRYVELMLSLLSPTVRYLLDSYDYDTTRFTGPPNFISEEDIQKLYEGKCNVELLEREIMLDPDLMARGWEDVYEKVHLITLK